MAPRAERVAPEWRVAPELTAYSALFPINTTIAMSRDNCGRLRRRSWLESTASLHLHCARHHLLHLLLHLRQLTLQLRDLRLIVCVGLRAFRPRLALRLVIASASTSRAP